MYTGVKEAGFAWPHERWEGISSKRKHRDFKEDLQLGSHLGPPWTAANIASHHTWGTGMRPCPSHCHREPQVLRL